MEGKPSEQSQTPFEGEYKATEPHFADLHVEVTPERHDDERYPDGVRVIFETPSDTIETVLTVESYKSMCKMFLRADEAI